MWLLFLKIVTPIGKAMNHLQELKRISALTTNLATHMILKNMSLDEAAVQLIKTRQELDKIIDALVECHAGDDNA